MPGDPFHPDLCPTCGKGMECECEPPIMTVEHDGVWKCEGCGRGIPAGTRVYLYRDEDDDTVVAHIECPPRAQA